MRITLTDCANILRNAANDDELRLAYRIAFEDPQNIDTFSRFFFPEAITTVVPAFHMKIYDKLFTPKDEALAAPRGHGKSTVTGLVYLIWKTVYKQEDYIVYVSQNHAKTVQFIEPVAFEFNNNKLLKFVYGVMTPRRGKDEDGRERQDCIDINGIRIEAVSFEKNLRGFKYRNSRPTLIILDDIESDDRVLNPELRAKDKKKLNRVIIPSLDPIKGKIKMIGTVLNTECLLLDKIRTYDGLIYKACDENFDNILMPELWTKDRLLAKKASIGWSAFAAEYLNSPVDAEYSVIKAEWVRKCYDETLSYFDPPEEKYDAVYLGVDFAFSDRVTADKSAFVGIGLHGDSFTLHSIFVAKGMSVSQQFDYIEMLVKRYKYTEVAMEENSIRSMSDELKNTNKYTFPYTLYWTGATDEKAKIKPEAEFQQKRHTVGKKAMIMRLAVQFEQHNIRIPYKTEKDKEISEALMQECVSYALDNGKLVEVGVHPDIPIALAMAMERASKDQFAWVI